MSCKLTDIAWERAYMSVGGERKYHPPDTAVPRATPTTSCPGYGVWGQLGHAPVHCTGRQGVIYHGCLLDLFDIFLLPSVQIFTKDWVRTYTAPKMGTVGPYTVQFLHCKKRLATSPSPAGMSLTKLFLAGSNWIIPGQGEFGWCHPGWGRENCQPFLV